MPGLDGHHSVGDRAGAFLLAHRRLRDDVGGRGVEVHLVDPQIGVDQTAELVYRGAAGNEILHHLRRHLGRIGRDPARRDAVVAGEHDRARVAQRGRMAPLPGREPHRQLFESAERAGRFCQLAFAQRCGAAGVEVRAGEMREQPADLRRGARRHATLSIVKQM